MINLSTVSSSTNFKHSTSNFIKSDLVDESLRDRWDLAGDDGLEDSGDKKGVISSDSIREFSLLIIQYEEKL